MPTMTTFIIYGEQSGIIRRVVSTDDPASIVGHVGEGEAHLEVSDAVLVEQEGATVPSLDHAHAELKAKTGIEPECARCLVISHATGEVVGVVQADPLLDKLEGHTLFQDSQGDVGYVPDAEGNFVPPGDPA